MSNKIKYFFCPKCGNILSYPFTTKAISATPVTVNTKA